MLLNGGTAGQNLFILIGFALLGLSYGQSSGTVTANFSRKFRFVGAAYSADLAWLLGAALALPVGQCQGRDAERTAGKARAAEAAAAAHKANTARVEAQAAQREADTARNLNLSKGRTDAIQAGPDGPLSGPELRLQCRRLRDIGYGPADLPPGC
jgi:hypothetical protein